MTTVDASDPTPAPTGDRLLQAAERLFAERGIGAVSLRAVMTEAGTNVASVHYHYGSKDALVEAVIRRRGDEIAERRTALLDAADAADTVTARELAEAFVVPIREVIENGGAAWVKVIADIVSTSHPALAVATEGFTDQAVRFQELMTRADPDAGRRTLRFRLAQAMTLTFKVLGDIHGTQDLVALSGSKLSTDDVVRELTDVVTAILEGPTRADSTTTRR